MGTLTLKKYESVNDWLKKEYPKLFTRPMAIGIKDELKKAKPYYISNKKLNDLLRSKSMATNYLRIIIEQDIRYHLDGSVMGNVPEKHKNGARKILEGRGKL